MSDAPIIAMMAQLCVAHRERHGAAKPIELRLVPCAYRAFRNATSGADTFFDIPVRCTERLPNGWHVAIV